MFNLYEYLLTIRTQLPDCGIYRISGLSELDEFLQNLRNIKFPAVLVEDTSDGFLDLSQGSMSNGYYSFWVVQKARLNDSDSRIKAKQESMAFAMKIIKKMVEDSREFDSPVYGLDRSRIDYSQVGPIGGNCYGYNFNPVIRDEKINLP